MWSQGIGAEMMGRGKFGPQQRVRERCSAPWRWADDCTSVQPGSGHLLRATRRSASKPRRTARREDFTLFRVGEARELARQLGRKRFPLTRAAWLDSFGSRLLEGLRGTTAGDPKPLNDIAPSILNVYGGTRFEGYLRGGPQAVQVASARVDDDGVIELLATAIGGGQDHAEQIAEQYRRDPASAVLRASIAGDAVGMVGYTTRGTDLVILHIATREDVRRAGIGSRMLHAVRDTQPGHQRLVAETDAEAVGFYIATGFDTESLGEKYPGVERFHVHTLTTDPDN